MIPLIVVCGKAGSGKDSFGNRIAEQFGGLCIGLADPMKKMMKDLLGFTDLQLFGPSAERDRVDPGLVGTQADSERLYEANQKIWTLGDRWIEDLLPGCNSESARTELSVWWLNCLDKARNGGGLSPRYVLQTIGTEWGRGLDPEIWSRRAVTTARRLLGAEHTYTRTGGLVRNPEIKRPPNLIVITDGRFANEIVNVKSAGGVAVQITRPNAEDTTTTGIAGHKSEAGLDEVPAHFYDFRIVNNGSLDNLNFRAERFGGDLMTPKFPIHTSPFFLGEGAV